MVKEVLKGEKRKRMESKFKLDDKFVKKGTCDSVVMCIERINYRFGQEPTYDMKPFKSCGNRQTISEDALIELYNKID